MYPTSRARPAVIRPKARVVVPNGDSASFTHRALKTGAGQREPVLIPDSLHDAALTLVTNH
jgi:hypothetical protein